MGKTEAILKLYRIAKFYYSYKNNHRKTVVSWIKSVKKNDEVTINFLNTQFGERHINAIKEL